MSTPHPLTGMPGARYLCCGCGRWKPGDVVTLCEACGEVVCATCDATCPHRAPAPGEQATFLGFWRGDYGTLTDITANDKE